MTIVGIPDVVVLETVNVKLQPASIVPVDVRHEEIRVLSHPYHHRPNHDRLNFIRDLEDHQLNAPTDYFCLNEK